MWITPANNRETTVPRHGNRDLARGTDVPGAREGVVGPLALSGIVHPEPQESDHGRREHEITRQNYYRPCRHGR